ncbi:hypothetical protein [Pseudonocardia sp. N23]|uniref:hypothetical protein n=1 Tax=Pseudonocardia sp. N23 TaxID=1987376 RepID=UPI00114589A7|nr:hypothetical protein [Pseudonocardia sp. N23]
MDVPDLHEQPVHVRRAAHVVTAADRVETAAQLLHSRRHRAGLGSVCGACRDVVREIADVLDVPRLEAVDQRARDSVDPLCQCGGCGSCAADYILTGQSR